MHFQRVRRRQVTPVTDEYACFPAASPAKFSLVIKKTINLKPQIHSSNYLPNTHRWGVTVRAARAIATSQPEHRTQRRSGLTGKEIRENDRPAWRERKREMGNREMEPWFKRKAGSGRIPCKVRCIPGSPG